jgi:hypothetical protein
VQRIAQKGYRMTSVPRDIWGPSRTELQVHTAFWVEESIENIPKPWQQEAVSVIRVKRKNIYVKEAIQLANTNEWEIRAGTYIKGFNVIVLEHNKRGMV